MVLVDDEALYAALLVLRDCTGLIVEPSAVAGLAALATRDIPGERVGTIITGGNYGPDLLRRLTSRIP
jgi:threonine dehydratase